MSQDAAFVWNGILVCHWSGVTINSHTELTFHLEEGNCCDMEGAVYMAQQMLPEVYVINTYSGNKPDTRFIRHSCGWTAELPQHQKQATS